MLLTASGRWSGMLCLSITPATKASLSNLLEDYHAALRPAPVVPMLFAINAVAYFGLSSGHRQQP